jgi:hypothetical protein
VSGLGGIERELPPSSKQAHPHFSNHVKNFIFNHVPVKSEFFHIY